MGAVPSTSELEGLPAGDADAGLDAQWRAAAATIPVHTRELKELLKQDEVTRRIFFFFLFFFPSSAQRQ